MSAGPQTTTIVTPPTTIDQGALDATWPQCFLYSGRAVETDNSTQVVPIEGAVDPSVEFDPGPAPSAYIHAVACVSAGCQLDLKDDVLHLTGANTEQVADLVRTTTKVP